MLYNTILIFRDIEISATINAAEPLPQPQFDRQDAAAVSYTTDNYSTSRLLLFWGRK